MQENKQKQTRANNSCVVDQDCNDLQKKTTERQVLWTRAELLKQHLSESSLERRHFRSSL